MSIKNTEEELYFEPALQDDMHLQAEALVYTKFSDERCDRVCKKTYHLGTHFCTAPALLKLTMFRWCWMLKSRHSRVCSIFHLTVLVLHQRGSTTGPRLSVNSTFISINISFSPNACVQGPCPGSGPTLIRVPQPFRSGYEKPQFRWTVRYKPSGSPRQQQKEINQFVSQTERRAANKVWPNLRGPCPNRQWPNVIRRIWQ